MLMISTRERAGYLYFGTPAPVIRGDLEQRKTWGCELGTENKPVEFSHRPRPLCVMTVAPEQTIVSFGEWPLHMAAINL